MLRRFIFACLLLLPPGSAAGGHLVDWSDALREQKGRSRLTRGIAVVGDAVPARIVCVEIPPDETVIDVEIAPLSEVATDLDTLERAAVAPVSTDAPLTRAGYPIRLLGHEDFRGHRIAYLLLTPFRSTPGGWQHLERFELTVSTRPAADHPALARRIDHPRTTAADHALLAKLLDAAPLPARSLPDSRAAVPPELDPTPLEYVVITNDEMAPVFEELAELKTREGLPAQVTTIEWILASYEGNDVASRVRAYVRDLYLYRGLRYVMIAGDTDVIPTRMARTKFLSPEGIDVTAEIYFAALDGTWNADGNEHLGEAPDPSSSYAGDDVDLLADVSVARVPVSTATQAAAWVAKWKSYTGYDPATFRTDYQDRMFAAAEVLFPANWDDGDDPEDIALDGADLAEFALDFVPAAFTKTRAYEYWNNPQQPGVPLTYSGTIAALNSGYGIFDHVGHGFRTNMSMGDRSLQNDDADALTNTNAYSVMYAVNCTSAAILFDCIAEHLIRNPSGGVIGLVGSTDIDYPTVSRSLKEEFFDLVFDQDVTTLGDAYYAADVPFAGLAAQNDNTWRWTLLTLMAMGDPAMEIWRGSPATFGLSYDLGHPIGDPTFSITITDDGAPVAGARVCLSKSDDAYGVAMTDSAGVAVVDFLPTTTGPFDITIVKNSFVPSCALGNVIPGSGPSLRVDSVTWHEGTGGGGSGNGDGRPDAGESVVVDVTIRNVGTSAASAISATFVGGSVFVTETDGAEPFPDIDPGATATVTAAFAFDVAAGLPVDLRHVVADAEIQLTANEGAWTEPVPISLYQRIFDLTGLDWSIPDDDGDGVLESGETVEITLTVLNIGEATADDVNGVASYAGPDFMLIDDAIAFGDVTSGASATGGPIRAVSTGGTAEALLFDFTLTDTYGSPMTRRLDLMPPAAPGGLAAEPSPSAIRLTWSPVATPDLRGYRVSRAPEMGGPFVDVSGVVVVDDGSFFEDEGLEALTPYFYRVAAVDSAGNEGPATPVLAASTAPTFLAGWPRTLPSGQSKGSPTIAQVDGDPGHEIALGWSYPMLFHADGTDVVDGDDDPATIGIFADEEGGASQYWLSPPIEDIDLDGRMEIIYAAFQTNGQGHLYVFDETGAVEPGWPREIGKTPWSTPVVADVDGGPLEIFVGSGSGSGTYRGALMGFRHDGSEIIDGDGDPGTHGIFHLGPTTAKFMYGSPAAADLDDDGFAEIVFLERTKRAEPSTSTLYAFDADGSVLPGFPFDDGLAGSTSSPAIADFGDDGSYEIVVVTSDRITVVTETGTEAPGWPKVLTAVTSTTLLDLLSSPAIGDVNGDGQLDVALGWTDGELHLWTGATGDPHPGFPVELVSTGSGFDRYMRSPIIGNVDGDVLPEIIVSSGDNRLFATKADGTVAGGFPLPVSGVAWGSAALGDIDANGEVDLVVQTDAPVLEVYDLSGVPYVALEHPWPMFRHGRRKTGRYETPTTVHSASGSSAVAAAARVGSPVPNPAGLGAVRVPYVVPAGGRDVVVRVFDVAGREVRTLADGRFPAGAYTLAWDGRGPRGRSIGPGQYFVRVEIGEASFTRKVTRLR